MKQNVYFTNEYIIGKSFFKNENKISYNNFYDNSILSFLIVKNNKIKIDKMFKKKLNYNINESSELGTIYNSL